MKLYHALCFFCEYISLSDADADPVAGLLLASVCVAAACFIVCELRRAAGGGILSELRLRPPFPLTLTWHEFEAYPQNTWNMMLILGEGFWLMASDARPFTQSVASPWMEIFGWHPPMTILYNNAPRAYLVTTVLTLLWIISWVPLYVQGGRFANDGGLFVRAYMRLHPYATFGASFFFIPLTSTLLFPFVCETSWVVKSTLRMGYVDAAALFIAFAVLVPISGHNERFPMMHAPDSDVRMKRSFAYLQTVVTIAHVATAWNSPCRVLTCAALFLLNHVSAPHAFDNTNQVRGITYLLATFVNAVNMVGMPLDATYYFVIVFGALTLFAVTQYAMTRGLTMDAERMPCDAALLATDTEHRLRLTTIRNAITAARLNRLTILHHTSSCQYSAALSEYRMFKCSFLEPFYLPAISVEVGPLPVPVPAVPTPVTPLAPTMFAQSELDRCTPHDMLGRGRTGTVRLGLIPQGDGSPRLVAAKEIPFHAGTASKMFDEVNILRRLVHPNIVRYYGMSVRDGKILIFMEYAVDGDLASRLKGGAAYSPLDVKECVRDILQGLEYLHTNSIIHRDIKCANILMDAKGHARLADFGCSKLISGDAAALTMTSAIGTPTFMAPEVIKNVPYDTAADIWSLGCTVVQILSGGEGPWKETFQNPMSAMYHIANNNVAPSNVPETASSLCRDFLAKCFARDPKERPRAVELLGHPWLAEAAAPEVISWGASSPRARERKTSAMTSGMSFDTSSTDADAAVTFQGISEEGPAEGEKSKNQN